MSYSISLGSGNYDYALTGKSSIRSDSCKQSAVALQSNKAWSFKLVSGCDNKSP